VKSSSAECKVADLGYALKQFSSSSGQRIWNPNAASVKVPRYPGSVGQPQGPLLLSIYARSREVYARFAY
jgi:hypothetical protein